MSGFVRSDKKAKKFALPENSGGKMCGSALDKPAPM